MHQTPKLQFFSSRLAVVFVQYVEANGQVKNEDVVGAAPTGDAPTTSELSTIYLPTRVHLILETWRVINSLRPSDAYMRQENSASLVQIMACRLVGAKPLSEPIMKYC